MGDIKNLFHAVEQAIKEKKSGELQDILQRKKSMPPPRPAIVGDTKTYSSRELMDMMCVTRVTIYNWMKNGWILGFKVNGDWRFTEDQVGAIMKRKGVPYGEES